MIYFENVEVLFFVILPLLVLAFLIFTNKSNFEEHFTKSALKKLSINSGILTTKIRSLFLLISLFFIAFAMSKPVLVLINFGTFQFYQASLWISFIFTIFGFYSLPQKTDAKKKL